MDGFDLIIFDCDGVLVDSEIIAANVESVLLTEAGYPISVEEMNERFAGLTWQDILFQIEREASIPISASLLDKSQQILDVRLEQEVQAIPGVEYAVGRLPMKRCICSNSSSKRLDMMLGKVGLKQLFAPNIFSAKDLGPDRAKPKPDIFLHGASQMGVAFQDCRRRRFHPWRSCRACGRHAGYRLHRRLAYLSIACRQVDGCGRRDGDFTHERSARRCRRIGGVGRRALRAQP